MFPCVSHSQLSATHLTHLTYLHVATMAPSPVGTRHRLKGAETRKGPEPQHDQTQDQENEPKRERRPSATPNLLHDPEKQRCFRSRNVISLVSVYEVFMKQRSLLKMYVYCMESRIWKVISYQEKWK